jgi:hypothetical protein
VDEGYERNGIYNQYYVRLRNSSNVAISCAVVFDYEYLRLGAIASDRRTVSTGRLNVGAESKVTINAGSANSNITLKRWTYSCEKWPFA